MKREAPLARLPYAERRARLNAARETVCQLHADKVREQVRRMLDEIYGNAAHARAVRESHKRDSQ
jgi:hypothetical protein